MLAAPKAFASLSSGLLARKGQARPAMRRQMAALDHDAHSVEDLGWNDMGEPAPDVAAPQPLPTVLAQREELAETFSGAERAPVAPVLPTGKRRAAFTLRLDAERHLRLRLAAATRGVSGQKLVTEALDEFLKSMTDLETLAANAPGAN